MPKTLTVLTDVRQIFLSKFSWSAVFPQDNFQRVWMIFVVLYRFLRLCLFRRATGPHSNSYCHSGCGTLKCIYLYFSLLFEGCFTYAKNNFHKGLNGLYKGGETFLYICNVTEHRWTISFEFGWLDVFVYTLLPASDRMGDGLTAAYTTARRIKINRESKAKGK